MSLERRSRIAGPRAIFRSRPYLLVCDLLTQVRAFLRFAAHNPSRINTSANSPFFIKSLIINGLKSNRISQRAHKYPRISTSETCACKPFRINTSKKYAGGRGVAATEGSLRCGRDDDVKFRAQSKAADCLAATERSLRCGRDDIVKFRAQSRAADCLAATEGSLHCGRDDDVKFRAQSKAADCLAATERSLGCARNDQLFRSCFCFCFWP